MNYLNFNRTFVRKMAMLTALVFAACSENNDTVAGGTVEETGVYALVGQVGNVSPRVLKVVDANGNEIRAHEKNEFIVKKGDIVTLAELDSVSLDTTGKFVVDTIFGDNGRFAFHDVSFASPYVLISVNDSCLYATDCNEKGILYEDVNQYRNVEDGAKYSRTLNAIVDMRNSKEVSVNVLTHVKMPILRELVASGISFKEANKQAERLVLESYGVYDSLSCFECLLGDESSELVFVNQLAQEYYMYDSTERSNLNNMTDLEMMISQYWRTSPEAYSFVSEKMTNMYWNTIKMLEYKLAYWSLWLGKGRCTEENEGASFELPAWDGNGPGIVCRSGKWQPGYEKIAYTRGTMIDARDGKKYKTVTYNIGEKEQTWMAEDLNYVGNFSANGDSLKTNLNERSSCHYKDDSLCVLSGREYRWEAAMNLNKMSIQFIAPHDLAGDTAYMPEICMSSYRIMSDSTVAGHSIFCSSPDDDECLGNLWWGAKVGYCAEFFEENGGNDYWTWNYAELMPEFNSSYYQGICPEGWRIPNKSDWDVFSQYIMEEYGADSTKIGSILSDDVATGFGMKNVLHYVDAEQNWIFASSIRSYIAVPDFQLGRTEGIVGVQIDDGDRYAYWLNHDYHYVFDSYVVRCIKK